tara:strand:- start:593 stop:1642 length:1050 start_codon:yes stop_codon:yes gene_type:complete
MKFNIVDYDNPSWGHYYNELDDKSSDIFYNQNFGKVYQKSIYKNYKIKCATLECDSGIAIYPFVLRSIIINDEIKINDITGYYGRNGIASNITDLDYIQKFHNSFYDYCINNDIVTSFDRFHPIINNHKLSSSKSIVKESGNFIILNLKQNIEKIENNYKHMHRKSIKKAIRGNVNIFYEKNMNNLDSFIKIYHRTLKKRNAPSFYFYPKHFYELLGEYLPDNFIFFYAIVNDKIISCELILLSEYYCHSFFGGTLEKYRELCPNTLLKREIIRFLNKEERYHYFLLGGGVSPNDGIYRYKNGFAPSGVFKSYIGGTIYDLKNYQELLKNYQKNEISYDSKKIQFYDIK